MLALVGANDGRVFVVRIDQSGDARRFEKSRDEAFRASRRRPVTGLCASETRVEGGETRYGVLIATPLKLYALAGSYSLESVLARARATAARRRGDGGDAGGERDERVTRLARSE